VTSKATRWSFRAAAITFSFVLIIASFAPFAIIGPGFTAEQQPDRALKSKQTTLNTATPTDTSISAPNKSAKTLTESARATLRNASLKNGNGNAKNKSKGRAKGKNKGKKKEQNTKTELIATLNATLDKFIGENRIVSAAVFEEHKKVAAKTQPRPKAPQVAGKLSQADQVLAATSINDAEQLIARAEASDRVDSQTIETARGYLTESQSAFSRGLRQQQASPVARINAWHQSWEASQSAISEVAGEVELNITILQEADPVRDGNESVVYPVAAKVFTPQPARTEVSATVNGEERDVAVSLTEFGTNTIIANVTLSERVANITLTVSDIKGGAAPSENGRQASDALLLDGDGLNQSYEQSISQTDPLDPDSDSAATDSDKADNNVIDSREDFDGDGLRTNSEAQIGSDPFDADTDDDGLSDHTEIAQIGVDPLDADTNDNGIGDAEEDLDGDGLTNAEEADLGTRFTIADTDDDYLKDSAELKYGTNATDPDTDDDGILDGIEIRNGLNPTSPDSDGDGVVDREETYTVTVESDTASVDVTGSGDLLSKTSVERDRGNILAEEVDAIVGPVTEIESEAEVKSGRITLEYNESVVSDESQVAVARFNETLGTFVELDSTVDQENNTVTTKMNHFSQYAPLDLDLWKSKTGRNVPSGVEDSDVLMYLQEGNNYAYGTVTLHNASIDESIGNVGNADGVDSQGNGVPEPGATYHPNGCGDDEVHRLSDRIIDFNLETCGADDAYFLSYNILGENPSLELDYRLTNIGLTVEGKQYLTGGTINLTEEGVNVTDSDNDGLVDSIEKGPIPLANGLLTYTDHNARDTDGDGLTDGEELRLNYKSPAGYKSLSDPADPDTDGDGLTDYEEVEVWGTDPMDRDTDNDGLIDSVDPEPREETRLPEVEYETSRSLVVYQDELIVKASGVDGADSIDKIRVSKYVDPALPTYSTKWQSATGTVQSSDGKWFKVKFDYPDERLFTEAKPDKLKITVTDEIGSQVVIRHDVENGDVAVEAGLAAGTGVAVSTSPAFSAGPPGWVAVAGVTVGTVIGVTAMELAAESVEGERAAQEVSFEVPTTGERASWETPDGLEITLPSGVVNEVVTEEGEYERGFGWEYISETTSLEVNEIEHAIRNQRNVINENGEVRYIIGEGLSETERVILSIIGGTIVTASQSPAYNEDCGSTIDINQHDNPEHATRDGKPIDEVTTLKEVLENPTRIVDAGGQRYFILRVGTNEVLMVVTDFVSAAYQVLRTTLTGDGPGNAYKTVEDAMKYIKDRHGDDYEIVHDPENGIDC